MVYFSEIDGVEKGMILNIFVSIGHTAQPGRYIDHKDAFDQIGEFTRERRRTGVTLIDDCPTRERWLLEVG